MSIFNFFEKLFLSAKIKCSSSFISIPRTPTSVETIGIPIDKNSKVFKFVPAPANIGFTETSDVLNSFCFSFSSIFPSNFTFFALDVKLSQQEPAIKKVISGHFLAKSFMIKSTASKFGGCPLPIKKAVLLKIFSSLFKNSSGFMPFGANLIFEIFTLYKL